MNAENKSPAERQITRRAVITGALSGAAIGATALLFRNYYKNKEDLLVSTYVDIKKKMGDAFLKDFNDSLPIRLKMFIFSPILIFSNPRLSEKFNFDEKSIETAFSQWVFISR